MAAVDRGVLMPTVTELERYAEVALRIGLGDIANRRLLVLSHVEAVEFVRAVATRAYSAGVLHVDVLWTDPVVSVITATEGPAAAASVQPDAALQANAAAGRGDAVLRIVGGQFPTLDETAGQRFAAINARWRSSAEPFFNELRNDNLPWAALGYPTADWARQVFPDAAEPVDQLWDAIARVCRLDEDDPVDAWLTHVDDLDRRAKHVNSLDLVELRYEGPGTDLSVGVDGRTWVSASSEQGNVANIPTEEVYTSPWRDQVQGSISLTKPYIFAGTAITDTTLTFENGVVTSATCSRGQQALDALLDTDDGSSRLGEVALVPHSSRVARERLQWHHPLFDENEDCHIALGASYPFTAPGGTSRSPDEQLELGLNHSRLHEDVVVGSQQLHVTGVDRDGHRHPLLIGGEWGFTASG